MKSDKLFGVFWNIKDDVIENSDGTMSMSVVISPKYGKFFMYIWYILNTINELCKNLTFKKRI